MDIIFCAISLAVNCATSRVRDDDVQVSLNGELASDPGGLHVV
ncbi:hypothetical protein [Sorangium cellulosum]|nr:hypothetical protein [Sorangium cellulosum]